ncbi:XdhC and CoxI family protein [Tenacibaculum sp. SZ-18]|uniref:XdhC family protein n=1 Tax=Tenacibaculum sp. SZ-18 TaxID=754423 RepID=UPI000C2D0426|nr:XdhC/CoxI family protein [Tenacibaculum sp. SZ-18]AUC14951.1 XdhC and CoxI family protein [Tenacibaculum sp. SZ-18]
MTHEFKNIVNQAITNQNKGIKNVLATVVYLEGSSYRKPGVRMLLSSDGKMVGAVSGGCVEKEVQRRAKSVFETSNSKVITYDGRYRLGCEGILYILLEPFHLSPEFFEDFEVSLKNRDPFQIDSSFKKEDEYIFNIGSMIKLKNNSYSFSPSLNEETFDTHEIFQQTLQPCFRLLIIGGEHDAVKLCASASLLGWEVDVITSEKDPKQLTDFPGANSIIAVSPEIAELSVDNETAVVLMNHNYVKDLKYLIKLEPLHPFYIGILGSAKRREQLQNELFHYTTDLSEKFLDTIYSPAGLNIGAITPEEIALSILSEILAITRKKTPVSLRTLTGKIHA